VGKIIITTYRSTSYHIQQASDHLSTLEEAFKPMESSPKAPYETAVVEDVNVKSGMGLLLGLSQRLREKHTGNKTRSTDAVTRTTTTEKTAPVLPELEFQRDRRVVSQNLQAIRENDADRATFASDSKLTADSKTTNN
jgi:hypothetical protein